MGTELKGMGQLWERGGHGVGAAVGKGQPWERGGLG